jgi:hypothetical protein
MNRHPCNQQSLFPPWFAWQELPDAVRRHALDVLTALYLETVDPLDSERDTDDSRSD